jgi:hypothetical protein
LLTVVICPIKGWDLKTQKGASDFGCLKDKWARFECFISGVKPKVSKLLTRHLSGESDGREDRGTHYEGPGPEMGEEDIMY